MLRPGRRRALRAGLAGAMGHLADPLAWAVAGLHPAARATETGTAGTAGAAGGRRVTDLAGRSVRLPARLQRLASAGGSPAVNAFLFLFGLGPRIASGLPAAFRSAEWDWQRRFAPQIVQAPVVSGPPPAWSPDTEALLALQPDLCLVVSSAAAAACERIGLPALVLQWDAPDAIERTVALLAEVFDDAPRAQAWRDWSAAQQAALPVPPATRPRVLYLRTQPLLQPIRATANRLIRQAGGLSVTEADNPLQLDVFPFSTEQLLAWNPEVLLVATAADAQRLRADERLSGVAALRQGRLHVVPHGAHLWSHYTPEQPLGVRWLAARLQPRPGDDAALRREAGQFYQRFFGVTLGSAELERLLPSA